MASVSAPESSCFFSDTSLNSRIVCVVMQVTNSVRKKEVKWSQMYIFAYIHLLSSSYMDGIVCQKVFSVLRPRVISL